MTGSSDGNGRLILSPKVSGDVCSDEQFVLQGLTTTIALDQSCQLDHSLSSTHQESHTTPLVTSDENHQFPNDMDIYDLDVVSGSTEVAPVAFVTPLKVANNEDAKDKSSTQYLHAFQIQLETDPVKVQEDQHAIRFNTRTSQIVDHSNVDHCPTVTTSSILVETPLNGISMIKKKEYTVVGDRSARSFNRGAISTVPHDNLTLTYTLANSSSSNKTSAGIFDRKRLKLNARHTGIHRNFFPSGPTSLTSSCVNSEGLTCVSLGGSGHTYLMSMLLLQHSRRSANKNRTTYVGSTLLAPSSSRAETGWRPITTIANEGKSDGHNNNLKNKVTSQTIPEKRVRCKHLDEPIASRGKGSTGCKTILSLEMLLPQK